MADIDPLAIDEFWEQLGIAGRPEFMPLHARKQSTDGRGNMMSATFGVAPKWSVDITLSTSRHDRHLVQEADIAELIGRDGKFLAYDTRRPFPEWDPDGSILGDAAVKVKSKGSDNRSLALEDLPARFRVTKSDKLSILYGTTKYFLCAIKETIAADASGDTAEFKIWPYMPPGVSVGDAVTLIKAPGKFKILADSYRPSSAAGNSASGASFSMISVP